MLTLFSQVECVTHIIDATFDITLETCERLAEVHYHTPEHWGLGPLQYEMGRTVPLNENLVYVLKLPDDPQAEPPRGVPSLSDTIRLLILSQIDAQFLQRNEPIALQRWTSHFGMDTDGTDVVDSRRRSTATNNGGELGIRAFAAGDEGTQSCNRLAQALGLPERVMDELLSAVFCRMCHQISPQGDGTLVQYDYRVLQTRRRYNNPIFLLSGFVCCACRTGFITPAR